METRGSRPSLPPPVSAGPLTGKFPWIRRSSPPFLRPRTEPRLASRPFSARVVSVSVMDVASVGRGQGRGGGGGGAEGSSED